MLGIIFFCLIFGVTLGQMGDQAAGVIKFFAIIDEVVMRLVGTVMWISPIGITSVITGKILQVDDLATVMAQLTWFLITTSTSSSFQFWITMFQAWMTAST